MFWKLRCNWRALPANSPCTVIGALTRAMVRLIAVTGYGQRQDRARAERAGFDAHFVKPVSQAQLLAAIESPR